MVAFGAMVYPQTKAVLVLSLLNIPTVTEVEEINSRIQLVSGTDDLNVNTEFSLKFILDRMKENGREHLCANLRYPGAVHLIEPPYSPFCSASHCRAF